MNVIGTNDVNAGNLIFASGGNNSIIFGFEPSNLPNLLGWYSSDYGVYNAPGVLATDGQTVRTWQNRVNNGINLNQTLNINYPPIYLNGGIQFSQNTMSGVNPYSLNSPLTYYVATQTILSGSSSTHANIIKQSPETNRFPYGFAVNSGSKLVIRANLDTYVSNITMLNGKNIIFANFSGVQPSVPSPIINVGTKNLTESTIFNIGTNTDNTFIIGGTTPTPGSIGALKGSIYEILIYTGLHTETEKNQVITYLSNKWGVN